MYFIQRYFFYYTKQKLLSICIKKNSLNIWIYFKLITQIFALSIYCIYVLLGCGRVVVDTKVQPLHDLIFLSILGNQTDVRFIATIPECPSCSAFSIICLNFSGITISPLVAGLFR